MISNYRQMRAMLIYDLPMIDEEDVKIYNKFRNSQCKETAIFPSIPAFPKEAWRTAGVKKPKRERKQESALLFGPGSIRFSLHHRPLRL